MYYLNLLSKIYSFNTDYEPIFTEELFPFIICCDEIFSVDGSIDIHSDTNNELLLDQQSDISYNMQKRKWNNYTVSIDYQSTRSNSLLARTMISENQISVIYSNKIREIMKTSDRILNYLSLETFLIMNNSFILHSSLVEFQGKALIFCGTKDVGKSTQAKLWERYMSSKIINGDRSGISFNDGNIYAFGLPLAGSSGIYVNQGYPLSSVILLEKKDRNRIRRVSKTEAFMKIYPEMNIPRFDKRISEIAIKLLELFLDKVPVYVLECTPDYSAVETVYREIFRKSS